MKPRKQNASGLIKRLFLVGTLAVAGLVQGCQSLSYPQEQTLYNLTALGYDYQMQQERNQAIREAGTQGNVQKKSEPKWVEVKPAPPKRQFYVCGNSPSTPVGIFKLGETPYIRVIGYRGLTATFEVQDAETGESLLQTAPQYLEYEPGYIMELNHFPAGSYRAVIKSEGVELGEHIFVVRD